MENIFLKYIYDNAGNYMSVSNDSRPDTRIGDFCEDTAYLIHSTQFGDGVTEDVVRQLGTDVDAWEGFMKNQRGCDEAIEAMKEAIEEFVSGFDGNISSGHAAKRSA